MNKLAFFAVLSLVFGVLGCVTHLAPLSPGVYMSSKHVYLIGTNEGMIEDAVAKANEFCAKRGKLAAVQSERTTWFGAHGHAQVIFVCVPPQRFSLIQRIDGSVSPANIA